MIEVNDEPRLLVADSFRVRRSPRTGASEVRGLDRHLDRFTRGVLECWPGAAMRAKEGRRAHQAALAELRTDPGFDEQSTLLLVPNPADTPILERVDAFLAEALPQLAAAGEGFPRLELWGGRDPEAAGPDPELRLSLRPLPELRETIELSTVRGVRLDHPGRKGPNIARLAELNRELGAEALLLDQRGRAVEGATTSLIWWTDDGDESGHTVRELSLIHI